MRQVTYKDERGYLRRTLVRDGDGDEQAKYGIPSGPMIDEELDWEEIKRQINNYLVENGVSTWVELQQKDGLGHAGNVVRRHLADLFRRRATEAKHGLDKQ